jgi:hypothetical protein
MGWEVQNLSGNGGKKIFPVLKVPRQCLFVLLVQGKALGSEEEKGLGTWLCYEQTTEIHQELYCLWSEFWYWRCKGWIAVNFWYTTVRASLGQYFYINIGRGGCVWSRQCNMEFGYQFSIYSRTEENHGKTWLSWPVAGTSGCKVASRQLFGI